MFSRICAFWKAARNRPRLEAEMDEELRFHMDARSRDLVRSGVARREAERVARVEFGTLAATKEECRSAIGLRLIDEVAQDLRYAARGLRKNPGFATAVVLTLALGIGATTAVFSVVDEALLRPLPVPQPDRLVNLFTFNTKTARYVSSSFPDYEAFRQRTRTLEQLSAFVRFPTSVTAGESAQLVSVEAVTGNYFAMLRLPPIAGRAFTPTDDARNAKPVAMIHEDYWRRVLGASPDAIGKTILIEDRAFNVIGVVPHRFRGPNLNWQGAPQVWIPLRSSPLVVPPLARLFDVRVPWLVLIGRLDPNYKISQAEAELQVIAGDLARTEHATNKDLTAVVLGTTESKFWPSYRGVVGQSLRIFAVAAALVLLLACANISNLLLERAVSRRREIALRVALGARHSRLVRQVLTENLMLAAPGFLVGLLMALGLQLILLQVPNAFGLPLALDLNLNLRVALFCSVATLAAVLLFGLAPALRAPRRDVLPSLKDSGSALSPGGDCWLRLGLVAAQIAFSMMLLTSGGLFVRSLLRAYSIDLGFRADHLLTVEFHPSLKPALLERFRREQMDLVSRLSNVPVVESVALANSNLLSAAQPTAQVSVEASGPIQAVQISVDPDFFRTARIEIVRGRAFTRASSAGPMAEAIVNQALAALLWRGADAVGRVLTVQGAKAQVIGVARNSKYESVWEAPKPCVYLATSPAAPPPAYLMLRTRVTPELIAPIVRREWEQTGSHVLYGFRTGEDLVDLSVTPLRVAAGGLGAFGLLAVLLASLGLYSVMAYSVRQRTREFGIRVAIGARPQAVFRHILGRSFALAAVGGTIGAVCSSIAARVIGSQLHGIPPNDGVTLLAVALLLAFVSVAASLIPALRAARIDPVVALRNE